MPTDRLLRRTLHSPDKEVWVVLGARGAIDFERRKDERGGWYHRHIGVHSPRQLFDFAPEPDPGCPYLEGDCWMDQGFLVAEALGTRWQVALRDDEVIWRELERWYAGRLSEPGL